MMAWIAGQFKLHSTQSEKYNCRIFHGGKYSKTKIIGFRRTEARYVLMMGEFTH
jgi:hypothetical protein